MNPALARQVDTVFVVVSQVARGGGDQHGAHTRSLQPLRVECARKLEELLWPTLQVQVPGVAGREEKRGRMGPLGLPRARAGVSQLHAGPQVWAQSRLLP